MSENFSHNNTEAPRQRGGVFTEIFSKLFKRQRGIEVAELDPTKLAADMADLSTLHQAVTADVRHNLTDADGRLPELIQAALNDTTYDTTVYRTIVGNYLGLMSATEQYQHFVDAERISGQARQALIVLHGEDEFAQTPLVLAAAHNPHTMVGILSGFQGTAAFQRQQALEEITGGHLVHFTLGTLRAFEGLAHQHRAFVVESPISLMPPAEQVWQLCGLMGKGDVLTLTGNPANLPLIDAARLEFKYDPMFKVATARTSHATLAHVNRIPVANETCAFITRLK